MRILKKLFGILFFSAGLLLLLLAASNLLMPKDNSPEAGMENPSTNGILAEAANTVDVIVLGDSESFASISPIQIWRDTGYTSYVCGNASQKLTYSTIMLRRALQKQRPKIVILETLAVYRNIALRDVAFDELSEILPVFRYHDRWKSLRQEDFGSKVTASWTSYGKGFMMNSAVKPWNGGNYMEPKGTIGDIAKTNRLYVDRIKKLCDENGAELIFLSTPSPVNWSDARHQGIQALADKLGCTYIDLNLMNDQIQIDWSQDTRDEGDHLNNFGAVKVTKFLSEYLRDRKLLTDHRGDADYAKWDEDLKTFESAIRND